MTEAEHRALMKQQDSLIKYIRRQDVFDYVAHSPIEDCGYCVPRGVMVFCDDITFDDIWIHAKRYYPNMVILPMTEAQCISHLSKHNIAESKVRAICKKHGFFADKKYTRFQNNRGEPWLHIEHKHGFVQWYLGYKIYSLGYSQDINIRKAKTRLKFYSDAIALIEELKANGITPYNIQIGV